MVALFCTLISLAADPLAEEERAIDPSPSLISCLFFSLFPPALASTTQSDLIPVMMM